MEKTLAQLVKEYLAQPLQDTFQYSDIPDVTNTTTKPTEPIVEKPKPIIYYPNGGGDGGIGSLNPGGTPIEGGFGDGAGFGIDPVTGDIIGGGNIVDEFGNLGNVYEGTGITPGVNSVTGDLPGGGNIVDEFQGYGNITGGTNSNDFDGLGPITGGTNSNDFDGIGNFGGISNNDFDGIGNFGGISNNDFDGIGNFGGISNNDFDGIGNFGGINNNDFDGIGNFGGISNNDFDGVGNDFDDGTMTGGADPSGTGNFSDAVTGNDTSPGATGGEGGSGCFIKGTLITMADGSNKPVEQIDLEDEVAVGGKVFAVGKFLNTELYDYKGIKVSGSHMVNEDGVWMRVRDTKHGKSLGDDKNTVYVFGSENRRILINKILFTDYFEVNEQDILIEDSEDFFNNSKSYGKIIDKQNVDILNAS